MISIEFTESEKQALHYERFPHPRVQRKMETVWLKCHQLPHHKIAELGGISENTVRSYLREYQSGEIEALKQVNFYRPQSELMSHVETIEAYFRKHPPSTISEALEKIEELTGLRHSPTTVPGYSKFLLPDTSMSILYFSWKLISACRVSQYFKEIAFLKNSFLVQKVTFIHEKVLWYLCQVASMYSCKSPFSHYCYLD